MPRKYLISVPFIDLGFSFLFAGIVTLLLLIAIAVLGFMTVALLNYFGFAVINR